MDSGRSEDGHDEEFVNKKIELEERKLLVAQRKLESIRLLDELLERVKVNNISVLGQTRVAPTKAWWVRAWRRPGLYLDFVTQRETGACHPCSTHTGQKMRRALLDRM